MATTVEKGHDSEASRRDFLYITAGAASVVGAGLSVWPFIDSMNPAKDTLALATTEVDISPIEEGQRVTVMWRKKPVFIDHRTSEQIESARNVALSDLKDPQSDEERVQRPEWLVLIGICTHLGCEIEQLGQNKIRFIGPLSSLRNEMLSFSTQTISKDPKFQGLIIAPHDSVMSPSIIRTKNPRLSFKFALDWIIKTVGLVPLRETMIPRDLIVGNNVTIGKSVKIGANSIIENNGNFFKIHHHSLSEKNVESLIQFQNMQILSDEQWELRMFLARIKEKQELIFNVFTKNTIIESQICLTKAVNGLDKSDPLIPVWIKCAAYFLTDAIISLNKCRSSPTHMLNTLRNLKPNQINETLSTVLDSIGLEQATPSL